MIPPKTPGPARGPRSASRSRSSPKVPLPDDEAEFRMFAAAAGTAIVVLMGLVAVLVSQLP